MISVQEVVTDPDFIAPQPFAVLRSTGSFVLGGFQSTTTTISMFGPVQQASNRELQMLPEADRIGSVRSFWSLQPIYLTRGQAEVPGTHGEVPQGSGVNYTLSIAPPSESISLYAAGKLLRPNGVDYVLNRTTLTLTAMPTLPLYATWQVTVNAATNASDVLQYESLQYRVLQVYHDPGCGYYKALATRMQAD